MRTLYAVALATVLALTLGACDVGSDLYLNDPPPTAPPVADTTDASPGAPPEGGDEDDDEGGPDAPDDAKVVTMAEGDTLALPHFVRVPEGGEAYLRVRMVGSGDYELIGFMKGDACDVAVLVPDRVYDVKRDDPSSTGFTYNRSPLTGADMTGLLEDACVYEVYKVYFGEGGRIAFGIPIEGRSRGSILTHFIVQRADGSDRALNNVDVEVGP